MKSIVFYASAVILVCMMIVIIYQNQEKPVFRLLTVSQYYSYLYEENQNIEIPIYINQEIHPMTQVDSYSNIYLSNETETKKIQIELTKISYGHEENYLNESYHQYLLYFKIPYLDNTYQIDDLYMHMTLINETSYTLYLGELSIINMHEESEFILWNSLSGTKAENSFLSRLGEIYVSYDSMSKLIDQIEIGASYDVSFEVLEDRITIHIPYAEYLLSNVPILIHAVDGSIQTIANFRYLIDYQVLKESGPLIHAYAAD